MEYAGNPFTCFFTLTAEYIYIFETNYCVHKVGIFLIEHIDFCESIMQKDLNNHKLKIKEENEAISNQEKQKQFIIHFKKGVHLTLVENFLRSEM